MFLTQVLPMRPTIQELLPTNLTFELFLQVCHDVCTQGVSALELFAADIALEEELFILAVFDEMLAKLMWQLKAVSTLLTHEFSLRVNRLLVKF